MNENFCAILEFTSSGKYRFLESHWWLPCRSYRFLRVKRRDVDVISAFLFNVDAITTHNE